MTKNRKQEPALSTARQALEEHTAAMAKAAEPAGDLLKTEARLATAIQAEGNAQAALATVTAANAEKMREWAEGDSADAPDLDEEGVAAATAAVAKASAMASAARDALHHIHVEQGVLIPE